MVVGTKAVAAVAVILESGKHNIMTKIVANNNCDTLKTIVKTQYLGDLNTMR